MNRKELLWKDFEKLSPQVVIEYLKLDKSKLRLNVQETKLTRDKGVDCFISISSNNTEMLITVEAKFRSNSKLSLKDIATSVVYFLISNNVTQHYIVTNTIYTQENVNVIENIWDNLDKKIDLVDGHYVKMILQSKKKLALEFPLVSDSIINSELLKKDNAKDKVALKKKSIDEIKSKVIFQKKFSKIIKKLSVKSSHNVLLVLGASGVGKTTFIDNYLTHTNRKNYRFDLNNIQTIEILLLNIISEFVGIDMSILINSIEDDTISDIESLLGFYSKDDSITELIKAVKLIFKIEEYSISIRYYYTIIVIKSLKKLNNGKKIIICFDNIDRTTLNVIEHLFVLVEELCKIDCVVILEINNSPLAPYRLFDSSIWLEKIEQLRMAKFNNQFPDVIDIECFSKQEAKEFVKYYLPNHDDIFIEDLIAYLGYVPYMLSNAITLIKNGNYTSILEVKESFLPSDFYTITKKLEQYLMTFQPKIQREFWMILGILVLMDGTLSMNNFIILSAYFENDNLHELVTKSRVIMYENSVYKFDHMITYDQIKSIIMTDKPNIIFFVSSLLINCYELLILPKSIMKSKKIQLLYFTDYDLYKKELLIYISSTTDKQDILNVTDLFIDSMTIHTQYVNDIDTFKILVLYLNASFKIIDINTPTIQRIVKILKRAVESNKLFNDYKSTDFEDVELQYYIYLCSIYHDKMAYDEAYSFVEKALNTPLSNETLHKKSLIKLHRLKALIIKRKFGRQKCLDYLEEYSDLYPNSIVEMAYYAHLAIYSQFENKNKAITYFKKGIEICRYLNLSEYESWLKTDLAMCYIYNKCFDDADILCKSNLISANKHSFYADISRNANYLGCLAAFNGDDNNAKYYFQKSMYYVQLTGSYQELVIVIANYISLTSLCSKELFVYAKGVLDKIIHSIYSSKIADNGYSFDKHYIAYCMIMKATRNKYPDLYEKMLEEYPLEYQENIVFPHNFIYNEMTFVLF